MTGQPEWAQDYETVYRSLAKEYRELPAEQVDRLLVGVLDLPEGAGPGVGLDALLSPFAADYPTETVGRWWR